MQFAVKIHVRKKKFMLERQLASEKIIGLAKRNKALAME